jgi:hypothetical protein
MPQNRKKANVRSKRNARTATDEPPIGLWVDKEILRKHTQQQTPKTIIHGNSEAAGNRYLELADLVLGNKKRKPAGR